MRRRRDLFTQGPRAAAFLAMLLLSEVFAISQLPSINGMTVPQLHRTVYSEEAQHGGVDGVNTVFSKHKDAARRLNFDEPDMTLHTAFRDMQIPDIHKGKERARRLSEGSCASTAAQAGIDLSLCSSSSLAMSSVIDRQTLSDDGSFVQYASLGVDAQGYNGGKVCGCAGVVQKGNRPGTGGEYSIPVVMEVEHPIYGYRKTLLMHVPPNQVLIQHPVCDTPSIMDKYTSQLPTSSVYVQSLRLLQQSLANSGGSSGRRLEESVLPLSKTTGTVTPGTPMAEEERQELSVLVSTLIQRAEKAVLADSLADRSSTHFRNNGGVRAVELVDPLSGLLPINSNEVASFAELMRASVYISPELWEQSQHAVGKHGFVRLLWATFMHSSHDRRLSAAGYNHTYGSTVPRHKRSLMDTFQQSKDKFLSEFLPPDSWYSSSLARSTVARKGRELIFSTVLGVGGIGLASWGIKIGKDNKERLNLMQSTLDAQENQINSARDQIDILDRQTINLDKRVSNLVNATGNVQSQVNILNDWQANLSSALTTAQQRSIQLTRDLQDANNKIANVQKNMSDLIAAATGNLTALLVNSSNACEQDVTRTAQAANKTMNAISDAVSTLAIRLETKFKSTENYVLLTSRSMSILTGALDNILQGKDMFLEVTRSIYTSVDSFRKLGYRPFWSDSSLDRKNWPDDEVVWRPGSPKRMLVLDTVMMLQTERIPDSVTGAYPNTDTYRDPWFTTASAATHLAVEHMLTFACDSAQIYTEARRTMSVAEIIDMIGPSGECAKPLASLTVGEFIGNYTGAGARKVYNPGSLPLCKCWLTHRVRQCPIIRNNATHPLIETRFSSSRRITFFGLDGVRDASNSRMLTPCTSDSVVTVRSERTITSGSEVQALLSKLACPNETVIRNMAPGSAQAKAAGNTELASLLVNTYVFGMRGSKLLYKGTNMNAATLVDQAVAYGAAVPLHPRVNPDVTATAVAMDLCEANPDKTRLFPVATAATVAYQLITQSWDFVMLELSTVSAAMYGQFLEDMSERFVPFTHDYTTGSTFACLYGQVVSIQDAAASWVPVWRLERVGAPYSVARVYMAGLNATAPGATNAVPAYSATTTNIISYVPMEALLPGTMLVVGDIENCIATSCEVPQVGILFNISTEPTSYIYNIRERDISVSKNKRLARNLVGYISDTNTDKVAGQYIARSRQMTLDLWKQQNPDQKFEIESAGASVLTGIRELVPVANPISVTDKVCAGETSSDQGETCLRLEHFVWYTADTATVDQHLVGTPYEGCGTSIVCLVPRLFMQHVLLDVPGGKYTQTTASICPYAETDLVGLGLSSVRITLPASASGPTLWWYRFVCNSVNDLDDDIRVPFSERNTTCHFSKSPLFVSGGTLDPGAATRIPFSSPIANWTIELQIINPADGLRATCLQSNFYVKTTVTAPLFGVSSLTVAPVVSNERSLETLRQVQRTQAALVQATVVVGSNLESMESYIMRVMNATVDFDKIYTDISGRNSSARFVANVYRAASELENLGKDAIDFAANVSEKLKNTSTASNASIQELYDMSKRNTQRIEEEASKVREALSKETESRAEFNRLQVLYNEAANTTAYWTREVDRRMSELRNFTYQSVGGLDFLSDLGPGGAIADVLNAGKDLIKDGLGALGDFNPFSSIGSMFSSLFRILIIVIPIAIVLFCCIKKK